MDVAMLHLAASEQRLQMRSSNRRHGRRRVIVARLEVVGDRQQQTIGVIERQGDAVGHHLGYCDGLLANMTLDTQPRVVKDA